ncbi:hypothetical protein EVAR_77628_1 [Eumeta japonica]|uniref:Uncharacterized protein n=1 Tax=Eumeta variegata TaxID=151549 RepID=A0A4C1T7T3_EUMVA|nr:hypothetical protein EVAR_77628_1 [Eumeta japonica]
MERWLKGVKCVATSSNDAECSKEVRAENTAITDPDDDATTSSSTVSKMKRKKCDESYINLGFVDSNGINKSMANSNGITSLHAM